MLLFPHVNSDLVTCVDTWPEILMCADLYNVAYPSTARIFKTFIESNSHMLSNARKSSRTSLKIDYVEVKFQSEPYVWIAGN